MVGTSTVPGGVEEDQTGPDAVILRHQGQGGTNVSANRTVGTWNEMGTTITVGTDGGEDPAATAMEDGAESEDGEEERKP
eukprot:g16058.t1